MKTSSKIILAMIISLSLAYFFTKPKKEEMKIPEKKITIPDSVAELEKTNKEVENYLKPYKKDINNIFFTSNTQAKLKALLDTTEEDYEIYYNDNLIITLKKESNPISIKFKGKDYELIDNRNIINDTIYEEYYSISDVKTDNYSGLIDLRDYLIKGIKEEGIENKINEEMKKKIDKNLEILKNNI